mgnify:CR=1 FL=1
MVTSVTSLGRSGLSDWLVQRISAVVLLAYSVFILVNTLCVEASSYELWSALFDQTWVKGFTVAAALATLAHAWIGLWSISTDYLTTRHAGPYGNVIRWVFQLVCATILFAYMVWVVEILWG